MREAGQDAWWLRTSRLAAVTIAVIAGLVLVPILLSGTMTDALFLGLPLPLFALAILMPLAALGGIFWFAGRQIGLDHRYDVAGD